MPPVTLTLFGAPTVSGPGGEAELGSKSLALLAFLALEPAHHRREVLAALLWSDAPEAAARASLRQVLCQLRDALGPVVHADRHVVRLDGPVASDAADFLEAADRSAAEAARFDVPRFLAGFSLRGAEGFDEWVEQTRRRLLQRYEGVLREVAQDAVARSRWREALVIADRWIETDPLSEEATGAAMQALHCLGDRGAALARFQALKLRLEKEAAAAPVPWLADLARRIERAAPPPAPEEADLRPCFEADLVGREAQWGALAEAWSEALRGRAQAVFLHGEAGMGKTRLAEEFARWAGGRGGVYLRGEGYQSAGTGAFGAVAAALRGVIEAPGLSGAAPEWLSEASRLVPELRLRYPGVPAPAPGGSAERQRLFEAVAQLLLVVAAEAPVLLLVDDLHWCDAESCAMLQFLGSRLEAAPILFLGTITDGEMTREAPAARLAAWFAGRTGSRQVTIGPLSTTEVWQVVRQLGNVRAPTAGRQFARRLHDVTDGNPFHVIELLKSLFSQGVLSLTPVSREWVVSARPGETELTDLELPRSVREAIGQRVDRLPYDLRDVLVTVAMARRPMPLGVLSHVHGISRLRAAALGDALIERHLLHAEESAYRAAHPTLAAVIRGGLSPVRAVELHRAIALALEVTMADGRDPVAAAEIAWHAEQAGDTERAHRYALEAAGAAREKLAPEEERSWLAFAARVGAGAGGDLDLRAAPRD